MSAELEMVRVTWRQELKAFDWRFFPGLAGCIAGWTAVLMIFEVGSYGFREFIVVWGFGVAIALAAIGPLAAAIYSTLRGGHAVGWVRQDGAASVVMRGNSLLLRAHHAAAFPLIEASDEHSLLSLIGFSVVSANEWFATPDERVQFLDSRVIIAEFSDRPPMPVAQFGYARQTDITKVFLDLQNRILNRRREYIERAEGILADLRPYLGNPERGRLAS